jgi:uncharacterized membrane protein YfcA
MPVEDIYLAVVPVFLIAGFAKGVVGFGLPTVALALLTATSDLATALALLLVPSFVTNVWQAFWGGRLLALFRRFWSFLTALGIGTWIGVGVLAGADARWLTALLGLLLCLTSILDLAQRRMPAPGHREIWLSPVLGAANGILTGLTGSFVVPAVPYLQALDLDRKAYIQALGLTFLVATAALAASLNDHRLLSARLWTVSAVAVAPALVGMAIGQAVRGKMSEAAFRRILYLSLLALGAFISIQALSRL